MFFHLQTQTHPDIPNICLKVIIETITIKERIAYRRSEEVLVQLALFDNFFFLKGILNITYDFLVDS